VPAELEAAGAGEGLAEDQTGSVVESFEGLRVELVQSALLAARLGRGAFGRPAPGGSLAKDALQAATRDEFGLGRWGAHRLLLS